MDYHFSSPPRIIDWSYRDLASKFKGRILLDEDHMILEQVLLMVKIKTMSCWFMMFRG
jgi:hypothetical protein